MRKSSYNQGNLYKDYINYIDFKYIYSVVVVSLFKKIYNKYIILGNGGSK